MPVRPVIGMITAPNPKLLHGRHLINTSYVRAVIAAGGTPLLIPSDGDDGLAAEYLPLLHGLLVPGTAPFVGAVCAALFCRYFLGM